MMVEFGPLRVKTAPGPPSTMWNRSDLKAFHQAMDLHPPAPRGFARLRGRDGAGVLTNDPICSAGDERSQREKRERAKSRHHGRRKNQWHTGQSYSSEGPRPLQSVLPSHQTGNHRAPRSPPMFLVPSRAIHRMLQTQRETDPNFFQRVAQQPVDPNPPPTVDELRSLAKAARRKPPGPDGVPPYVLAQLRRAHFWLVHHYLCLMYHSRTLPACVSQSLIFCIYKQKKGWQDGDMWRPIACSISMYRLLTRWVYTHLQRLLTPNFRTPLWCGKKSVYRASACTSATANIGAHKGWSAGSI